MKKPMQYILLGIMILSAVFTVWLPIYIWPKEVSMEFDGIMFEEGNPSYSETVTIELRGHINKRMFGGRRYLGKIIIDKMDVRDEWATQTVRINLNTKGIGVMYYFDEKGTSSDLVPHAYVSMGNKGSSIVLSLIQDAKAETHMFPGSMMIAGPAADRAEAVDLSNELMKRFLDNPID